MSKAEKNIKIPINKYCAHGFLIVILYLIMNLTELKPGQSVTITSVSGHHHIHERLSEMGFVPGREVTLLYKSPVGTPLVFSVMGTQVALRREEAAILHTDTPRQSDLHVLSKTDLLRSVRASAARIRRLGQDHDKAPLTHANIKYTCPSCSGKCPSCFCTAPNCDTNSKNTNCTYKDSSKAKKLTIALIGNPNCGKTSLFNAISGGHEHVGNYSGVTVTSVIGETMYRGVRLSIIDLPGTYSLHAFSPEEEYVASELARGHIDVVINVIDVNNLERNLLLTLQTKMMDTPMVGALNLFDEFRTSGSSLDIDTLSQRLGMHMIPTVARTGEGIDTLLDTVIAVADTKRDTHAETITPTFPAIQTLLHDIYTKCESATERRTSIIDRFVAGSWFAYPLFFVLMWFMFWLTFTIGQYPMDWIDSCVSWSCGFLSTYLPEGWLQAMLVDGILGGVGSVIVFLPNILILYGLMTILEDSGYLARAALLADPPLSRIGLHGKSFIPMLMGFGCNVPAVMATRTIETGKSRLLTLFILPLMSCSARIPVYTAFAGAFFMRGASLVMMGLYSLGIVMAIFVAMLLNKSIMRGHGSHFVMELPPYRTPEWHAVWTHTWEKGRQYLSKMGGIILIASLIIWALNYITLPSSSGIDSEMTCMEALGHFIEPLLSPLGFDWRMGVGIFAGIGAKELMVSSLGVLYGVGEEGDGTMLQNALAMGTTPAALAYMVFALLYFPCIATLVAIKHETGHWHHAAFVAVYTTLLAWLMAWGTYHIAEIIFTI